MNASRRNWFYATLIVSALSVPSSAQEPVRQTLDSPRTTSTESKPSPKTTPIHPKPPAMPISANGLVRKTYPLGELSDDPCLGAWIAENIPHVVQPGTWNSGEAHEKRILSYFPPAKMLLVYHTPAAHAEIEEFLASVKRTTTTQRPMTKVPSTFGLTQTQFLVPESNPNTPPMPTSKSMPYPVPPQTQQPRHLFHFIIRYEGEGVVDSNVVELIKAQAGANSSPGEKSNSADPAPVCPVCPACPIQAPCAPATKISAPTPVSSSPTQKARSEESSSGLTGIVATNPTPTAQNGDADAKAKTK